MAPEVATAADSDEAAYREFLVDSEDALFTHSWEFRRLLEKLLPSARSHYLVLRNTDRIEGIFPIMVQEDQGLKVLNSLPFFGSHGGLVMRHKDDLIGQESLCRAFASFSVQPDVLASTVIESPFSLSNPTNDSLSLSHSDSRVGQVTEIPDGVVSEYSRQRLLEIFQKRARNSVARSFKSPLNLRIEDSPRALESLYRIHVENMQAVGGRAKPEGFPSAVIQTFEYGKDFKILTATDDGELVGGLLVFYFKDFIEYFMPATRVEYRVEQPMSGLIFLAMEDAILRGSGRRWNWGGTWHSQAGVYNFKAGFGAVDYPYRYFTRLRPDVDWTPRKSRSFAGRFPFFFVAPFPETTKEARSR